MGATLIYYDFLIILENTNLLYLSQPQTPQAQTEKEGSLEGRKLA